MRSFFQRRLWILLLLPVLLAANECSESGINQDIKDILGLDTDSPAQVAGAILLGKTFGDDSEKQAAEMGSVIKDFRRADHEQKGDVADKPDDKLKEYNESLRWTDNNQKSVKANLQFKIGAAYTFKAGAQAQDPEAARKAYLQSAAAYGAAADLQEGRDRGNSYISQGWSYLSAGAYDQACSSSHKATANGFDYAILRDALKARGYTCAE